MKTGQNSNTFYAMPSLSSDDAIMQQVQAVFSRNILSKNSANVLIFQKCDKDDPCPF